MMTDDDYKQFFKPLSAKIMPKNGMFKVDGSPMTEQTALAKQRLSIAGSFSSKKQKRILKK